MTARLTPQREAVLVEQIKQALSEAGAFCGECGFEPGERGCQDCETCWKRYADDLLPIVRNAVAAELAAVRAERDEALENLTGAYLARWEEEQDNDRLRLALESAKRGRRRLRTALAKYVGSEPTVAEEMAYLSRCLHAVHDLCAEAKRTNSLGITIEAVEQSATGERPENPSDRRRCLYIDGKGNGWVDLNQDSATGQRNVTGLTDQWQIKATDEVIADTGSLREIGRCW